jgi:hypothetical protein
VLGVISIADHALGREKLLYLVRNTQALGWIADK